jgi:hypothetical protein
VFEAARTRDESAGILMGNQEQYVLYVSGKFYGQAERAISNGQLNTSLCFHIRPIDVIVYHGPS